MGNLQQHFISGEILWRDWRNEQIEDIPSITSDLPASNRFRPDPKPYTGNNEQIEIPAARVIIDLTSQGI